MGVMTKAWGWLPAPTPAGQVGGHEGVGKVVKTGPGAEKSGVKIGDRVGIKWLAGICESCEACRAGADASCFNGVCFLLSSFFLLWDGHIVLHHAKLQLQARSLNSNLILMESVDRKFLDISPLAPSSNTSSARPTT